MNLLNCVRNNCQNIMCNTYIDGIGDICDECVIEFSDICDEEDYTKKQIAKHLRIFITTEKDGGL